MVGTMQFLRLEEVAQVLRVGTPTIRRWVAAGTFPKPIQPGRKLLWRADVVERFMANQEPDDGEDANGTKGNTVKARRH